VPTQVDLTSWQQIGEELSKDCYQDVLPTTSPNLTRVVAPVCIEPSGIEYVRCIPKKDEGEGEITFYFAPPEFVFKSYVNVPLYFFHEYLSHLHTAPLFGELDEIPQPFEDGWLLYLARIVYQHRLLRAPHPSLTHHLHREHYAECYFDSLNEVDIERPWIEFGFRAARHFESVVGKDLFTAVTLLVATSPYDYFPDTEFELRQYAEDHDEDDYPWHLLSVNKYEENKNGVFVYGRSANLNQGYHLPPTPAEERYSMVFTQDIIDDLTLWNETEKIPAALVTTAVHELGHQRAGLTCSNTWAHTEECVMSGESGVSMDPRFCRTIEDTLWQTTHCLENIESNYGNF